MKRLVFLLLVGLCCCALIQACDDENGSDGDADGDSDGDGDGDGDIDIDIDADGDGDGDGDSDGDSDGDADGDSDADSDIERDVELGDGACTNDADMAILDSLDSEQIATSCAIECIGQPDMETCSANCISNATGLSAECIDCFVGVVMCTVQHCVGFCSVNPESDACVSCRAEHCVPAFEECTGLPYS